MAPGDQVKFGVLLRRMRTAAGLTQEALATSSGLGVRTISDLERGLASRPRAATLDQLAAALQLTTEEQAALEASVRPQHLKSTVADPLLTSRSGTAEPRPFGNLTTPLTPLIGREREEAASVHLLRQADVRLLTLTGAPGIGKTRLALQVGADLVNDTPEGVFLVELAPISDPALVLTTIMRTLKVHETIAPDKTPLATLSAYLLTRRMLLILDNFEQVVSAAPQVTELLRACSGLKVLVTSRIALHVRGERRLAVPPLALPDLAALPPAQELAQYPAVALFLHRAQDVRPTFTLLPEQAPAVAAICHRLDGLPLAIELAATWTRLLSPTALLARLVQRLPLLTGGARDLPERQQTLRSAIDWSYDLLTPGEQRLLRRLSVFVGGCALEATELIGGEPGLVGEVLHQLAALVDTSLVDQYEEAGASGESRFRLLEIVREYALERLETSGEAEAIRERHGRYYLGLSAQPDVSETGEWVARLARENENLRAALAWSEQHDVGAGIIAAADLFFYWSSRSMLSEGRRWLEEFLALHAARIGESDPSLRTRALKAVGSLAWEQGDYAHAKLCYEDALIQAQAAGQRRVIASLYNNLGIVSVEQGDFAPAANFYQACLALREELERQWNAALAMERAGQLRTEDWEALWKEVDELKLPESMARTLILERLIQANQQATAMTTYNQARLAMAQEDLELAIMYGEQSAGLFADLGCAANEAQVHSLLGEIWAYLGDLTRARALLEQVLPLFRAEKAKWDLASTLNRLGRAVSDQGDVAHAVILHQESVALYQEIGDRRGLAESLEGLASAEAASGWAELAVRLLEAAAYLRQVIDAPLFPLQRASIDGLVADLQADLGKEKFLAIKGVARATPIEQMVAEVGAWQPGSSGSHINGRHQRRARERQP